MKRIGTVVAMTLCMGVTPLALTLVVAKAFGPYVESWSPESFGVLFASIHFGLFLLGAWIYATKVGD